MNSALLLRRLMVASAAVTAACGARTGDELDEPSRLLGETAAAAGRGGGSAGAAGAAQAGKAGNVSGGSAGSAGAGGSVTKIVTGCFDGASCVPGAWCDTKAGSVCACDAAGKQQCGQSVPWGMKTKVCFELSTPDLPCPSAQDQSLYQLLPWQLSCTGIDGGPDFHYIANSVDHPACCYDVGNFGCGGRPFVVSERGWTSRLVARADWV